MKVLKRYLALIFILIIVLTNTNVIELAYADDITHSEECDKIFNWVIDLEPTCTKKGIKHEECSCGIKRNENTEIDALGHDVIKTVVSLAEDCTGKDTYKETCSRCDEYVESIYNYDISPDDPRHHYETKWNNGVVADCGHASSKWDECTICGQKTNNEYVFATGKHTFDEGTITKEPTCTETGTIKYTCTTCGYKKTATLDALGHDIEWIVTTEPTCSHGGVKVPHCKRCDKSASLIGMNSETIPMLDHEYETVIEGNHVCSELPSGDADANLYNYKKVKCKNCGAEKSITPIAVKHNFVSDHTELYSEATCTSPARYNDICSECHRTAKELGYDKKYAEEIYKALYTHEYGEPLGHDYEWVYFGYPCADNRQKQQTCTRCGYENGLRVQVDPSEVEDHAYGEWTTTSEPNCHYRELQTRKCSQCGQTQTRWVGLSNHELYATDPDTYLNKVITKEPTCAASGQYKYTCKVCGEDVSVNGLVTHTIPMTEHNYEWVYDVPTCATTRIVYKHEECSKCHAKRNTGTVADDSEKTAHIYGDWELVKDATCTENGYYKRTCEACGQYETKIIKNYHETYSKDPEKYYTKVITREATCTLPGVYHYECNTCHQTIGVNNSINQLYSVDHEYEFYDDNFTCADIPVDKACTNPNIADYVYGYIYSFSGDRCKNCKTNWKNKTTKRVTHTYDEISSDLYSEATCTEAARYYKKCSVCGKSAKDRADYLKDNGFSDIQIRKWFTSESGEPLEHNYVVVVDKEPTCKAKGISHKECTLCGKIIDSNTAIPKAQHSYEWVIDKEPTCRPGRKHQECQVCGASTKWTNIPPISDHEFMHIHEDSGNEDIHYGDGKYKYAYGMDGVECVNCSEQLCMTLLPSNHSYYAELTHYPADDTSNIMVDGIYVEDPIENKHFVYEDTGFNVVSKINSYSREPSTCSHDDLVLLVDSFPSCANEGTAHVVCAICGYKDPAVIKLNKLNHNYEFKITKQTTEENPIGLGHFECSYCHNNPANNNIEDSDTILEYFNKISAGDLPFVYSEYQGFEENNTEWLHNNGAHVNENFSILDNERGLKFDFNVHGNVVIIYNQPTTEEKGTGKVYSMCDVTMTEMSSEQTKSMDNYVLNYDCTIAKLDPVVVCEHNYQWVVSKEPTCTETGYRHKKCSDCGEVTQDETINPLGHDEVWITDVEPTIEHEGKKHLECVRCKEKLSEDIVIPKLIDNTPKPSKPTNIEEDIPQNISSNIPEESKPENNIVNESTAVNNIEETNVPSTTIIEPIKPKEPTKVATAVTNNISEDSNVNTTNINESIHQNISNDIPEEPKIENNKEDNKIYRFITETIVPIWNGIIEAVNDNPSLTILPIGLVMGSGLFIFFIILPRKEDEDEEENDENEDNINQ